jgi:hypothetical protein
LIGGVITSFVVVELPDRLRLPRYGADVIAGLLGAGAFVAAIAIA